MRIIRQQMILMKYLALFVISKIGNGRLLQIIGGPLKVKQILVIHLVLSGDISWFSMVMVKNHTSFDLTARVLNLILKVPATTNVICFVFG